MGGVIKIMNSDNIFNAISPNEAPAFNSETSFADTATFVTSEQEATAAANLELLIRTTKETISNE
jgi:hypothetical protein